MDVQISEQKGVIIAALVGNLDSFSATEVQDIVLEKITTGVKFIFDMSACPFISSAGLRTLLIIAKRIKLNNACAVMAGLSDEITDVMEMTGFDEMFESYKTVDEAIKTLL
jgi:anti-anti-sigma factor